MENNKNYFGSSQLNPFNKKASTISCDKKGAGFSKKGVVANSIASIWQSRIGNVPKDSNFSMM